MCRSTAFLTRSVRRELSLGSVRALAFRRSRRRGRVVATAAALLLGLGGASAEGQGTYQQDRVPVLTAFDVGFDGSPAWVDLDADGDRDLVVGENQGGVVYFENTGTSSAPALADLDADRRARRTGRLPLAADLRRRLRVRRHVGLVGDRAVAWVACGCPKTTRADQGRWRWR